MKNRKREICTSGSVRDEDGNILIYSAVVDAVESGASRREAAEWFEVSPSSAIKWMQRRRATGSIAPKPSGGSISPLEEHADFLLSLIAGRPDLTLDEIVVVMRKRRIAGPR